MSDILVETSEITVEPNSTLDVTTSSQIQVCKSTDTSVEVNRREYSIVGDGLYIPARYEDAPPWLQAIIDQTISVSLATANGNIEDAITALNSMFDELEIAKNTYTQSIISSDDIDQRILTAITTLNSSLSGADATILQVAQTAVTPDEARALILEGIRADLNSAEVGSVGAALTTLQQVISNGDSALAQSISTLFSTLETVDNTLSGVANATTALETRVTATENSITSQASQLTNLSTQVYSGSTTWAAADSSVVNSLTTTINNGDAAVRAQWSYNNSVDINGTYYRSGFGINTSYTSGGSGTAGSPYLSEFWVDATRMRFTNSNATGRTTPFTIDASGSTPRVTFNGVVDFTNTNSFGTTTINGGRITTGTITAGLIVVDNIAVANTYIVAGEITATGTFGTSLTTGNTGYVGGFTVSNPSGAQMKVAIVGTGRTGVLGADTTGVSQAFGMFVGGSKVFDYGWSPLAEDAKSCTFTYVIPSGASITFDLYGAHTTWSGQHTINMQFSVLGVRN